jgi:CheY-like chemotaxis protein
MRGGWRESNVSELPLILVVEDDELLQGLIDETLREAGFDVAMLASGEEAVTLLTGHKDKYRARNGYKPSRPARRLGPPLVAFSAIAGGQLLSNPTAWLAAQC